MEKKPETKKYVNFDGHFEMSLEDLKVSFEARGASFDVVPVFPYEPMFFGYHYNDLTLTFSGRVNTWYDLSCDGEEDYLNEWEQFDGEYREYEEVEDAANKPKVFRYKLVLRDGEFNDAVLKNAVIRGGNVKAKTIKFSVILDGEVDGYVEDSSVYEKAKISGTFKNCAFETWEQDTSKCELIESFKEKPPKKHERYVNYTGFFPANDPEPYFFAVNASFDFDEIEDGGNLVHCINGFARIAPYKEISSDPECNQRIVFRNGEFFGSHQFLVIVRSGIINGVDYEEFPKLCKEYYDRLNNGETVENANEWIIDLLNENRNSELRNKPVMTKCSIVGGEIHNYTLEGYFFRGKAILHPDCDSYGNEAFLYQDEVEGENGARHNFCKQPLNDQTF